MLKNKKIIYLILYILLFVGVNFSTLVYAVTTGTVYLTTNKDSYENEENIELSINLKMLFIGQINILPNMNISIIQVKNVIIEFISKIITSK